MDANPDQNNATKVSAEILFAVSLAFALSIFLLNSSLSDRRELRINQDKREHMLSGIVDRLHSFRVKDAALFEKIVVSSLNQPSILIANDDLYPGLVRKVQLSPDSWQILGIEKERLSKLEGFAKIFGEKAAYAFTVYSVPDDRVREFKTLITNIFKDDPIAAEFLNNEVIPKLATNDNPNERWQVAYWIASEEWSEGSGHGSTHGVGITFGKRFLDLPSETDERFYIYRLILSAPNPSLVDDEVFNLWKQSHNEKRASATPLPGVALPVFGLSISADSVVAGAAPILIVLQLLFLIHWERRLIVNSNDGDVFTFPSFACPKDPFNGPMPKTLGEIAQRLIWMLFLILPTSLLSVGLLTRYDMIYPLSYFGNKKSTLFEVETLARSEDMLSSILDWVTVVCIALSVLIVLSITQSQSNSKPRNRSALLRIWFIALISAAACIGATLIKFYFHFASFSDSPTVHFNMSYLAAFGVLCSLCFGFAWQRRVRFLVLLSILGLVLFVLHFIPF